MFVVVVVAAADDVDDCILSTRSALDDGTHVVAALTFFDDEAAVAAFQPAMVLDRADARDVASEMRGADTLSAPPAALWAPVERGVRRVRSHTVAEGSRLGVLGDRLSCASSSCGFGGSAGVTREPLPVCRALNSATSCALPMRSASSRGVLPDLSRTLTLAPRFNNNATVST